MHQNHSSSSNPSPARLGLPNPSSTTLSNLAKNPSSMTLIPLIPPLPRAQSILVHMASLATKLFEVSTHRAHWVASFRGSLPTFLSSQTSRTQGIALSSTTEILSLAASLQNQLFESATQLQEILDIHDSHLKISRQIRAKDASLISFASKLQEARGHLQHLVDDYIDYYRPNKHQKSDSSPFDSGSSISFPRLDLSDILSYAHRISYTTFAPPEFGAGQAPLRGALPPAPQEEQLRASQLYNFSDLNIGLPEEAEAKVKTVGTLIEAPPPTEPAQVNMQAVQGMMIPPIPSGWRPGMPVELPLDLPVVPPGWKPGDPVLLPPLDGLLGPLSRVSEEQRPVVEAGVPKMPEPIQVRHVKLDIDSDHDEYSSDYSSSGSSEVENEDRVELNLYQ